MKFSMLTQIEKDGTGISSVIEKDGTGIHLSRNAIEKDGTGIKSGSIICSALMALALAAPVSAAEFSGVVNQTDGNITISLSDGNSLLTGTGVSEYGYALVSLSGIELPSVIQSEGDGTGVSSEGDGTGIASEGDGTGIASEGDGTGIASEGDGTGIASEGDGTGIASEGDGTGIASEGDGTGIASEGDGTGIASEGDGTGVARVCYTSLGTFSEGDGTGVSSEGDGTGIASEGDGTGIASEGDGTGIASEGDGTGIASEGDGTGISSVRYAVTNFADNESIDEWTCKGRLVSMNIGIAEVALSGDMASVLLYGVGVGGDVFEVAAIEIPVIRN